MNRRSLRLLAGGARLASTATVIARLLTLVRARDPIGRSVAKGGASISVVIPARDEAKRIEPLLAALIGAPIDEVIVVDDQSADDTARRAASLGVTVIAGAPLPDGWCGKPWALHQGVAAAHGDWIVALDADTRPQPELPGAMVARCGQDDLSLLTAAGRFDTPDQWARALQASMLTTLVYRFGAPGTGRVGGRHQLANGQCLAVRRDHLEAIGGFGRVRASTEEDVALARAFAADGYRTDFLDASDLLTVDGYPTLGASWSGWGRSIGLPSVESPARRLIDGVVVLTTMPLPLWRVVVGRGDPLDLLLVAIRVGTLAGTRRAFGVGGVAYWLSPVLDGIAWAAQVRSGYRSQQRWRGRLYRRPAMRAGNGIRRSSSALR